MSIRSNNRRIIIVVTLALMIMLILPILGSLTTNAVDLGPASTKATFYAKKNPGLVPSTGNVEVAPSYIFFNANIPLAAQLNPAQMGLNTIETYIVVGFGIDLDANMSTGLTIWGYYFPDPTNLNVYTRYAIPGIDEIISLKYDVVNNLGTVTQVANTTTLTIAGPGDPYLPPVETLNVSSYNIVHISSDGVRIDLNWSQLEQAYYNFTGIKINTKYHRIYLLASPITTGSPGHSIYVMEYVEDTLNCNLLASPVPIPNATVPMNESLKAWPNGSILCNDTKDNLGPLPDYYDAKSIYIARDNNNLYIGFLMNSTGKPLESSNSQLRYTATATLYYSATSQRTIKLMYASYQTPSAQYTVMPIPYSSLYYTAGVPSSYNFSYPFFEAAIPLTQIPPDPQNFTSTAVRNEEPLVSVYVANGLAPARINYLVIQPFIIDEAKGLVYSSSTPLNMTLDSVYGSVSTVLEYPGMRIAGSFDTGSSSTRIVGGIAAGPMSLESGGLPKETGVPFYYYFNVSNESSVIWPLRVYIPLSYKYNINGAIVYYYNKSLGEYVKIPSNYITLYKSNNTIMIKYDKTLYDAGDPGILVLAPYTVGGTLEDTSAPPSIHMLEIALLTGAIAAVAILLVSYKNRK